MNEKFKSPESEVMLKVGDLARVNLEVVTDRERLKNYIDENEIYRIYAIDVNSEEGTMAAFVGPIDLNFDKERFNSASDILEACELTGVRPIALKTLKRVAN